MRASLSSVDGPAQRGQGYASGPSYSIISAPTARPRVIAFTTALPPQFIVLLVCAFSSRSSLHQTLFLSVEASAACAWLTLRGLFDKEAARANATSWRPRWCAMRPFTMKESDHHASASVSLSGSESGHLVRAASVVRHGVQGFRMFGMVALSMCNFKYPAFLPRGPAKMARKFGVSCLPVAVSSPLEAARCVPCSRSRIVRLVVGRSPRDHSVTSSRSGLTGVASRSSCSITVLIKILLRWIRRAFWCAAVIVTWAFALWIAFRATLSSR